MTKNLLNIIKSAVEMTGLSDDDLLARFHVVHGGMLNNPSYPNPPVDMADFKAAIEAYAAAIDAVVDAGDAVMPERDKRRHTTVAMLRLLGDYIRAADVEAPSARLPPLLCYRKNGDRYERPRHIEAELRRMLSLSRSGWSGKAQSFKTSPSSV